MLGTIKSALSKAVPIAGGFYVSKVVASKLPALPGFNKLGKHAGPVAAVGAVLVAAFLGKRVGFLRKWADALVMGAGIAAVDVIAKTYLGGVMSKLGLGEYVTFGEYVEYPSVVGEYIDVDGYIEAPEMEGQGEFYGEQGDVYEELGADVYEELGDFAGKAPAGLGAISRRKALAAPQAVSALAKAGSFAEPMEDMYRGTFAKHSLASW
jgi:hypothetical protein